MKKVLIIAPNFPPESVGGASRIFEMAKKIQAEYNVTVICPPPTYPFTYYKKSNQIIHKEIIDGMTIYRVKTYQPSVKEPSFLGRFLYYTIFPVLTNFFLLRLLSDVSFVIISPPPTSVLITSWIVRLFKKKFIVDVRDLWIENLSYLGEIKKDSLLIKWIKQFENDCWKKADLVLVNSLTTTEEIKNILGKNSSKVKYFPFHPNLDIFQKQNIKKEKQVVYIGNFGIVQDLQILIKAMQIVISKIPNLKLKLYGGGSSELEIKKIVKELKLEKSIQFFNPVARDEIPLILSKSLIGIVSLQDNEGLRSVMPTKTFEYFACGLPVIAFGGSHELKRIMKKSEAGIHIDGNNYEEISEAIIKLLDDDDKLKKYSENGRKFMEEKIDYSFLKEI